ncbi:hypothetical protein CLCR_11211 [Cladophialophora carrionii]|uniref:Uncharacterized protein n=1 Tax=Cladophialophora carrionii TaxID=86049 RepID=A0A1C1C8V1_9EURO|nr:hypothetical protein CLCR_11211 [Cladophialophora carrionii]
MKKKDPSEKALPKTSPAPRLRVTRQSTIEHEPSQPNDVKALTSNVVSGHLAQRSSFISPSHTFESDAFQSGESGPSGSIENMSAQSASPKTYAQRRLPTRTSSTGNAKRIETDVDSRRSRQRLPSDVVEAPSEPIASALPKRQQKHTIREGCVATLRPIWRYLGFWLTAGNIAVHKLLFWYFLFALTVLSGAWTIPGKLRFLGAAIHELGAKSWQAAAETLSLMLGSIWTIIDVSGARGLLRHAAIAIDGDAHLCTTPVLPWLAVWLRVPCPEPGLRSPFFVAVNDTARDLGNWAYISEMMISHIDPFQKTAMPIQQQQKVSSSPTLTFLKEKPLSIGCRITSTALMGVAIACTK